MEKIISEYLNNLEIGKMQKFKNMIVFPFISPEQKNLDYITLTKALEADLIEIKEISKGGSIPNLKVINLSSKPVLLMDGEELVGAKQNRIINSTILLKEKTDTVIPVSCTESGRWSYRTDKFRDSGVISAQKVRLNKVKSVSSHLQNKQQFYSNQGQVWDDIRDISDKMGVKSNTAAMKDVFDSKAKHLDAYIRNFEIIPEQTGLVVCINNTIVGIDVVSLPAAYKELHHKLIKSYAIEAMKKKAEEKIKVNEAEVKRFIKEACTCKEIRYESVGYGWDYRYKSSNIIGSVLQYSDVIIHAAFFRNRKTNRYRRGRNDMDTLLFKNRIH